MTIKMNLFLKQQKVRETPEILLKALTYLQSLHIKIHIVNPELQTQLAPLTA